MTTQLSDECKSRLFRVTLATPVEGIAFVMADSREAASRIGKTVIAVLNSVAIYDVTLKDVHSFSELVSMGACDDEDMRVFEIAHADAKAPAWADAPYFLTNDSSLLGKWAELRADIAASEAHAIIRRAK
ncbi:hypothetical protein [Caballeronia concitans]|jgi:hypothetical protein|uniref:Uncharacterized protein n=1 Tax=Caballeronia concitans TaxID=1777133 RepID=A0A658QXQ1_9BURK|nr:hypothetical protein [Caballeronia concitans]KIG03256.1 hypothetical protein BurMR1_5118 [Burkholderia sp. MR1]SAL31805.1 hypothetical protein AWB72_02828 [Caballeronia concitans]